LIVVCCFIVVLSPLPIQLWPSHPLHHLLSSSLSLLPLPTLSSLLSSLLPLPTNCCVVCCPFACLCIVCCPHLSALPLCDCQCFCCWLPSSFCQPFVPLPLVMPPLAGCCPLVPPNIVCYGWLLLLAFASMLPLSLTCHHLSSPCPTLTIPPPHCSHCPYPLLLPAMLVTNCNPISMLPAMVGCCIVCCPFACQCVVHHLHLSALPLCNC
jgi:hypothetical protein